MSRGSLIPIVQATNKQTNKQRWADCGCRYVEGLGAVHPFAPLRRGDADPATLDVRARLLLRRVWLAVRSQPLPQVGVELTSCRGKLAAVKAQMAMLQERLQVTGVLCLLLCTSRHSRSLPKNRSAEEGEVGPERQLVQREGADRGGRQPDTPH